MPPRPRPCLGMAFSLENIDNGHGEEKQLVSAAQCEAMSKIDDHLFIGSWRDVQDPNVLRSRGITHILNVAKEVDREIQEAEKAGFACLHIPLVDEHRENILVHLEAACKFIEGARLNGGKCLVHCRRGISRSPAIVVGYLMREKMLDFESAVEYVKQRRGCVSLNIAFREFLCHYETPHMNHQPSQTFDEDGMDVIRPTPGPTPGSSSASDGHNERTLALCAHHQHQHHQHQGDLENGSIVES